MSEYYTGKVYISDVAHQTKFDINHLVFAPNSRNTWHIHPDAEQVLLILDGEGYYQEEGQEVIRIKKGDVIRTPANVKHWHGSTSESRLVHLSITERTNKGHIGGYWWLAYFYAFFHLQPSVNQLFARYYSVRQIPDGTKTGQNHRKIKSRTLQVRHPLSWTSLSSAKVRFCPVKSKQFLINMLSINHLYHTGIFRKIQQMPHTQTYVAYSKGLLKSVLCHLYTMAFLPLHTVLDKCTTHLPLSAMLNVCPISKLAKNTAWLHSRTKRHIQSCTMSGKC